MANVLILENEETLQQAKEDLRAAQVRTRPSTRWRGAECSTDFLASLRCDYRQSSTRLFRVRRKRRSTPMPQRLPTPPSSRLVLRCWPAPLPLLSAHLPVFRTSPLSPLLPSLAVDEGGRPPPPLPHPSLPHLPRLATRTMLDSLVDCPPYVGGELDLGACS